MLSLWRKPKFTSKVFKKPTSTCVHIIPPFLIPGQSVKRAGSNSILCWCEGLQWNPGKQVLIVSTGVFGTGTKSRLTFSFLTAVYPKCVGRVADFKPLLPSPPSVEECPSARVPERLLGKSREKAEEHQIHLLQAVGRRLCGLCCLVCEIKVQKDELCGNIAVLCKKKKIFISDSNILLCFPINLTEWLLNFMKLSMPMNYISYVTLTTNGPISVRTGKAIH